MKIQCNACEAAEASVLCCADEAALCWVCDEKVHAANKLAGKHQRVPLTAAASSQVPKCDICQESLLILESDGKPNCPDLPEDIRILGEYYASVRRTRADGNSFYRSFIFSFLEHILETQDTAELDHLKANIEEWKLMLRGAQYEDNHIETLLRPFTELLDGVIQGTETSISAEELLQRSRNQAYSDPIVMLLRYITSVQMRLDLRHYEEELRELRNDAIDVANVHEFCDVHVKPMGQESIHLHVDALADALRVPIRLQYFPKALSAHYHDYIPLGFPRGNPEEPHVKIIYCSPEYYAIPRYAILYPK